MSSPLKNKTIAINPIRHLLSRTPRFSPFACWQGAFWGLMLGLVVGVVRMGLDFGYGSPACGEDDPRPVIVSKIHFLHFTILLFVISFVSIAAISWLTEPIHVSHVSGTALRNGQVSTYII